ncbi:uncharacterized protein LOC131148359 [Malania oleifera]|uniref:uncharacterized protein LOC131148359 n=1 Tax=Malania oleifera TaxID=397392 RepID=UPI0025AE6DDB|nr:uncharacterized protein LOC131148359 [Malania oleifera]
MEEGDSASGDGDMLLYSSGSDGLTDSWILDSVCSYHKPPNKDWFTTYRQDKLILHAILASISELVMSLITASTTTHDVWSKLQQLYVNRSFYELDVIDSPISVDEITLYVLNGLGPKLHEIAAPIRACETSLTFEELHDMLVSHESYLRRVDASNSTLFATVNTTQCCTNASPFNRNQHSNASSYGQRRPNSGRYNRREWSSQP